MTPRSAATDTAHHLWLQTAGDAREPEAAAAAAERLCVQLSAGLSRWIGAEGYRALLDRAAGLARAEHPALGGLARFRKEEPVATAAIRAYDAAEIGAGMVALMAALIDLLGRIIGEEMAVHLMEQSGIPSLRDRVNTKPNGERDG